MNNIFNKNCCDGKYNSFDIHFTSDCDNKCKHCIDMRYTGHGIHRPNPIAIADTIIENQEGVDDVLFLGGEPCLYLREMQECITLIRKHTNLKIFVTTAVPKTCYDNRKLFSDIIESLDGINLSVQHYDERKADLIRNTKSMYDRQEFYYSITPKEKVRINLNIVKPYLYEKEDIVNCLRWYDSLGFNEIKLSEIQHGKDQFVSFEEVFDIKLGSPFFGGCQTYIDTTKIIPYMKTPLLLKRSCFLCEETLKASAADGIKVFYRIFNRPRNRYGVIYGDGRLTKGWQ